ncbi:MAG: hypothetical protein RLO81_15345 [Fulvivirga sp.]|uniref:hypothetical protein n=1 Tax=Fulvivirga sp. TaxID=1931237 RepID=UPI0032ED8A1A
MIDPKLVLITTFIAFRCANREPNRNEHILTQFYNSSSRIEHLDHLSTDYELHFGSVTGKGINKSQLANLLKWDYALNPDRQILEFIKLARDTVILRSKEENDFSKLIKYPGWESVNTYVIDERGLIKLQLYQPRNETSYKPYLKPAIEWLVAHDSLRLAEVYDLKDKALIQDSVSATKWIKLLREWRASNLPTYRK